MSSSSRPKGACDERDDGDDRETGRWRRAPRGGGRGPVAGSAAATSGSFPGLAIAILANELGEGNGVGILALVAFGIAPDVPRLFGRRGRPVHNLVHQPGLPAAAVAIAGAGWAAGILPGVWLVGSLVWLGHVIVGRGVNDVPRPAARSGLPMAPSRARRV